MSDASAMVERCGRHQHPELFGGHEVDTTCSARVARAIAEMSCDRGPVLVPSVQAQVDRLLQRDGGVRVG